MVEGEGGRFKAETVVRAVNALLKWRRKRKRKEEEGDEADDDFMYLTVTLNKIPRKNRIPHTIPLPHPLLSGDPAVCLIVDGKKITVEAAHGMLRRSGGRDVQRILKLSKLKSEFKSFESKKNLRDSFDLFLATVDVVPFLDGVLGKVFYGKKKKMPVPVKLLPDGSNWTEEIDRARRSSLVSFGGGTCAAVRVGKWGSLGSEDTVENVLEAVGGVVGIVSGKWRGVRCFHLKFSDSLALPIYDPQRSDDQSP
ncbi:hypothetical protein M569_07232 [Genlisea aurea]|uniref:Ribosomal protein L1 n=1 Tax=Genlisea aurea TaxID=192259 RepID=S8E5B3_9LAMI|nr:hypothetical protein M569_07232 [Genlisea aurea]